MGLLDSVLGAVLGGQQPAGGQAGGTNLAALIPVLAPVLENMLAGNGGAAGAGGGLGGLVAKFGQAGLGDVVNSWVGHGANQAVDPSQVSSALGSDTIGQIASQLGLSHGDTAGALAQILPGLVDKLTPNGQLPAAGANAGAGDLMGMLSGLLQQK